MIAETVKVKVIGQNFSCMYRVSNVYDRVCIEIHDTRYTIHDVFVYRVPNSDADETQTQRRRNASGAIAREDFAIERTMRSSKKFLTRNWSVCVASALPLRCV